MQRSGFGRASRLMLERSLDEQGSLTLLCQMHLSRGKTDAMQLTGSGRYSVRFVVRLGKRYSF